MQLNFTKKNENQLTENLIFLNKEKKEIHKL